jgi:mono/diheme cytochrome c family protein
MTKGTVFFLTLIPLSSFQPVRAEELDLATAQKQYNKYCAKCHGAEGHGDGEQGATLKQKPKVFTDATEMAKVDDKKLFDTIKLGGEPVDGRKSDMPAMGKSLSDFEIRCLVAYVRNFCQSQHLADQVNNGE